MASNVDGAEAKLAMMTYYPPSKDFERVSADRVVLDSLRGPEYLEAMGQAARERQVAMAEAKILGQKLRWCYRREGVNYLENCKQEAEAYFARISSPDFGMLRGAAKFTYGSNA